MLRHKSAMQSWVSVLLVSIALCNVIRESLLYSFVWIFCIIDARFCIGGNTIFYGLYGAQLVYFHDKCVA